jgi:hypothetical protein
MPLRGEVRLILADWCITPPFTRVDTGGVILPDTDASKRGGPVSELLLRFRAAQQLAANRLPGGLLEDAVDLLGVVAEFGVLEQVGRR